MPPLRKANAFSSEVEKWLSDRTRFGTNVHWEHDYRLSVGGRDFVDIVGVLAGDDDPTILIEVELHREDPVSNAVKIMKWCADHRRKKVVFFQAFSKLYKQEKLERKKRAVFLGEIFQKQGYGHFVPLDMKYSPRPGGVYGAGRRTRAAKLIARRVMQRLLKLKTIKRK
jgi:hypothetical protein